MSMIGGMQRRFIGGDGGALVMTARKMVGSRDCIGLIEESDAKNNRLEGIYEIVESFERLLMTEELSWKPIRMVDAVALAQLL